MTAPLSGAADGAISGAAVISSTGAIACVVAPITGAVGAGRSAAVNSEPRIKIAAISTSSADAPITQ